MATIDMQSMRYINLLDNVSNVKTRKCFIYNNILFFAVPERFVSKAIGSSASNVKKLQEKIGRKIKVIKEPEGIGGAQRFVEEVVGINLKSLEVRDGVMTITGGSNQNKATLIGRNKRRFEELKKIIHDFFGTDLKVV